MSSSLFVQERGRSVDVELTSVSPSLLFSLLSNFFSRHPLHRPLPSPHIHLSSSPQRKQPLLLRPVPSSLGRRDRTSIHFNAPSPSFQRTKPSSLACHQPRKTFLVTSSSYVPPKPWNPSSNRRALLLLLSTTRRDSLPDSSRAPAYLSSDQQSRDRPSQYGSTRSTNLRSAVRDIGRDSDIFLSRSWSDGDRPLHFGDAVLKGGPVDCFMQT